jgi:magnesium transporter
LSKKKRDEILSHLDEKTREPIDRLLELSRNQIGKLVTTEYLTVNSNDTARQVFDSIKKMTVDFASLDYIYAINKNQELIGVFSLHELILQDLETPVYKFMIQNVIVIHLTTPLEIVVKKMLKYKLYALPVMDTDKRIQGVVTLDDINSSILKRFA